MCPTPISEAQFEANRRNAQHSTGPRTHEGKSRSRLNGLRHGLSGQTVVMPYEDRKAWERHCADIIESLQPETEVERALARAIADDQWRLNRARAIEENIFALGLTTNPVELEDADARTCAALTQAQTFLEGAQQIQLLSLYESRINRTLQRNMQELQRLQAERKAEHARQLEEAALLAQLAENNSESYEPKQDGFGFSTLELTRHIDRARRLAQAKMLRTGLSQTKAARSKAA